MTNLYVLRPEVAGSLGDSTVISNRKDVEAGKAKRLHVSKLEYSFDGWSGDELLKSHPCYIVTAALARSLKGGGLRGVGLGNVKVTTSEIWDSFAAFHAKIKLPPSKRLLPEGEVVITKGKVRRFTQHDVLLSPEGDLVVSQQCLKVLRRHTLTKCAIKKLRVSLKK